MRDSLLETLAKKCNCFISSLPSAVELPEAFAQLREISFQDYPIEEWNYCVSYLLHRPVVFSREEELNSLLESEIAPETQKTGR